MNLKKSYALLLELYNALGFYKGFDRFCQQDFLQTQSNVKMERKIFRVMLVKNKKQIHFCYCKMSLEEFHINLQGSVQYWKWSVVQWIARGNWVIQGSTNWNVCEILILKQARSRKISPRNTIFSYGLSSPVGLESKETGFRK